MAVALVAAHGAVAQLDDVVGHVADGLVVRDHDDGVAVLFVDVFDQLQDLLGRGIVQRAGWLVAEEDVRILHDGAADGHALLLATGELVGQLVPVLVEPERVQQLVNIQRRVREIGADLDVLLDVQVGDQVIELKDVAQVLAAVLRERFLAHVLELVAADGDEARVGAVDPADDVQQGGLARAGRAEQDADLAARDRKRHPTQDLLPGLTAAVALFQVHDLQKFVFFCHL